jgi:PEP-CTERM motif
MLCKKLKIPVLAALLLCATALTAQASVLATLYDGANATTGDLYGTPEQTVGWGVTLDNNVTVNDFSYWLLITDTVYLPASGFSDIGAYQDIFAASSFAALAPNTSYTSYYNPAAGTGLGAYTIGAVPVDSVSAGTIEFSYSYFTANPLDPESGAVPVAGHEGLTFTSSRTSAPDASITVVPEPSTYALLCLSLGVVGFARKRMVSKECEG